MNRLTEIKVVEKRGYYWYSEYECTCGNKIIARQYHVKTNGIQSCGCLQKENRIKHGMHKSDTYSRWAAMKNRCKPTSKQGKKNYFDRGIGYCKEWEKFESFYADMGDCNGLEIDRIDNDKGYSKENCRWTTHTVQIRNQRKRKSFSQYRGVHKNLNGKRWISKIVIKGKLNYLGTFDTQEEAALAWNAEASKHQGYQLNEVA